MAKKEKRDVLIPHKFLSIFETLVKQGKAEQAAQLTIAIIKYDMTEEEPTFTDPGVAFVWESVIKPQLEENKQKYKAVSKARSEAVGTRYNNATNEYKCSNSNQMNNENTFATDIDVDIDVDVDNDCDIGLKEKINKKEKQRTTSAVVVAKKLISDFAGDDKDLEAALNDFLSMRKKIKKPLTDRALQQRLKKLQELSGGDQQKAAAIVDQTVNHCWQDFYPLKDGNDKNMTAQETDDKATEILESGEIDGIFD